MRGVALTTALEELRGYGREPANYLCPLFSLEGPGRSASVIATLNFDVTVEQQAHLASCDLYDGFIAMPNLKPPVEWENAALKNLRRRWEHVTAIGCDFAGFAAAPADLHLLLKLHGSIGWYSLEEGADKIGTDEITRHNPIYRFFRIPNQRFWEEKLVNDDQILRVGEYGDETLTRKAGALWINPSIAFARGHKATPDPLTLELLRTFSVLVDAARTVVTVGYSWADAHVNDLLLGGVARGARLVHIGLDRLPIEVLKLWRRKFGTTFGFVKQRLFVFGGGAKRCLGDSRVVLPNGEEAGIDLIAALNEGLSRDLSLERTLPQVELEDPPRPAQQVRLPTQNGRRTFTGRLQ